MSGRAGRTRRLARWLRPGAAGSRGGGADHAVDPAGGAVEPAGPPTPIARRAGWLAVAAADGGTCHADLHRVEVRGHDHACVAEVVSTVLLDRATADHVGRAHRPRRGADLVVDLATGPDPRQVQVRVGRSGVTTLHRRADAADAVLGHLTRHLLDADLDHPRVHAGAVATPDGRAAVLLGESGAGKSTLTAHLVAGGHRLVTDEAVTIFEEAGRIGGATRPVAVARTGLAALPDPSRAGVGPGSGPGPGRDGSAPASHLLTARALGGGHALVAEPALLVLLHRDADALQATWSTVAPAEAAVALCANNLDLVRRPRRALGAFGRLAGTVPTIRLRYAEARDAALVLADLLDAPPSPPDLAWAVEQAAQVSQEPDAGAHAVRPAPEVLALALGADTILFDPATRAVSRLNPAGAALWATLPWPDCPDDGDLAGLGAFLADLARTGFVVVEET